MYFYFDRLRARASDQKVKRAESWITRGCWSPAVPLFSTPVDEI
jgi:hypothetical protein